MATRKRLLVARWHVQFLAHLNLVRILQFVLVSIEDAHVLICISIKLLADLGQGIAGLHRIALATFPRSTTSCRTYRAARIDSDVSSQIVSVICVDQFDLLPQLVFHGF